MSDGRIKFVLEVPIRPSQNFKQVHYQTNPLLVFFLVLIRRKLLVSRSIGPTIARFTLPMVTNFRTLIRNLPPAQTRNLSQAPIQDKGLVCRIKIDGPDMVAIALVTSGSTADKALKTGKRLDQNFYTVSLCRFGIFSDEKTALSGQKTWFNIGKSGPYLRDLDN